MSSVRTPVLPDDFLDLARERVAKAYSEVLDLSAAELLTRGSTDDEGEPSIGAFPTWHFDHEDAEAGTPLPVTDLTIRIACEGDADVPEYIYPFRTNPDTQDGLVGRVLAQLHFEVTMQMNSARPLEDLEDADLHDLFADAPDYYLLRADPNNPELHARSTLARIAIAETEIRARTRDASKACQ